MPDVTCPICHNVANLPESALGRTVRCTCGLEFTARAPGWQGPAYEVLEDDGGAQLGDEQDGEGESGEREPSPAPGDVDERQQAGRQASRRGRGRSTRVRLKPAMTSSRRWEAVAFL